MKKIQFKSTNFSELRKMVDDFIKQHNIGKHANIIYETGDSGQIESATIEYWKYSSPIERKKS